MCGFDDSFGPDAYSEAWRKARKEHRCCACHETIRPGDQYHYISGIWDGRADSYKHCARCWTLHRELVRRSDGGEVDLLLNCGETYEGSDPNMLALAFMTRDEAQTLPRT